MIKSFASLILILAATALAVSFVAGTAGRQKSDFETPAKPGDQRVEQEFRQTLDAKGANRLKIRAHIAELTLRTSASDKIIVHAVRWYKGNSSESASRWMEESHLTVWSSGDELSVVDSAGPGAIQNSAGGNLNCGLDLQIDIPTGLKVSSNIDAGTAVLYGNYEALSFNLGAGSAQANFDPCPASNSNLSLGAGEIKIHLPPLANIDVQATTGVGQVIGLPTKSNDHSTIHIGDSRSARIGKGGPALDLHVGAGSIRVESTGGIASAQEISTSDSDGAPERILLSANADSAKIDDQTKHKDHLPDVDVEINQSMKDMEPELDRELSKIGPEIDSAMKEAQPEIDRAMAEAGQEVARALAEIGPEIKREVAKAQPDIERAIKEARRDGKLRLNNGNSAWGPEQARDLKEAEAEINSAEREAEKAMAQAMIEMRNQTKDDGTQKMMRDAMKNAQASVRDALNAAREAIRQFRKSHPRRP